MLTVTLQDAGLQLRLGANISVPVANTPAIQNLQFAPKFIRYFPAFKKQHG